MENAAKAMAVYAICCSCNSRSCIGDFVARQNRTIKSQVINTSVLIWCYVFVLKP